jgi:hypothetical protein
LSQTHPKFNENIEENMCLLCPGYVPKIQILLKQNISLYGKKVRRSNYAFYF